MLFYGTETFLDLPSGWYQASNLGVNGIRRSRPLLLGKLFGVFIL